MNNDNNPNIKNDNENNSSKNINTARRLGTTIGVLRTLFGSSGVELRAQEGVAFGPLGSTVWG